MKKNTPSWKLFESILCAIVELFNPLVEAVVHDIKKGTIAAIFNPLSGRKVGDLSPLKELHIPTEKFPNYFKPYYKTNRDGKPLKCTSITIRDKKGLPSYVICINCDITFFREGQLLLDAFFKIHTEAENPVELFGSQFEKHADTVIQNYLTKKKLQLPQLRKEEKRALIKELYNKGLFNFKNTATYLAKKLGTSRATIYNYLKDPSH